MRDYYVLAGAAVIVGVILRQLRLMFRDRGDRKFARYVFDQTRSTEALHGYTQLIHETNRPIVPKLPQKQSAPPGG